MNPVLAVDLSRVTILDICDYNLAAAVQALDGDVAAAQARFPELFVKLTGPVAALTEDEFWSRIAEAAAVQGRGAELRSIFLQQFQFRAGVRELLSDLATMRVRVFIWTNMPNKWLEALDRQLGLDELVSGIVNGQNLHHQKPDPDFFQLAVDLRGLDPDQVIYISDRVENRDAAKHCTGQQWPVLPNERIIVLVRQLLRVDAPIQSSIGSVRGDW